MNNNNFKFDRLVSIDSFDRFVGTRIQSEEEQIQKMETGENEFTGLNSKSR